MVLWPFFKGWSFSVLPLPFTTLSLWTIWGQHASVPLPVEYGRPCYFIFLPHPTLLQWFHSFLFPPQTHVKPTNCKVFVHFKTFAPLYLFKIWFQEQSPCNMKELRKWPNLVCLGRKSGDSGRWIQHLAIWQILTEFLLVPGRAARF